MIVYTYKKEKVILSDESFAAGGEGEVRFVSVCPSKYNNLCAKLYFKSSQTEEQERKIRFMVENPPNILVGKGGMLAWPVETIYSNTDGGFVGFLMPTAFPESKKLVILTALKLKKRHKTEWHKFDKELDKKYALIARMKVINNIAIPIYHLHQTKKYVLKDFKPDNVLVTPTGQITIVDMDSIQICDNGRLLFPGTVATENYIPPEYYNNGVGRDTTIPLDKSWDLFALAVVFYQLLFGLSPYAVIPKSDTEDSNTIPYAISHNLFPFGKNRSSIEGIPEPHENFKIIPTSLQELFIRAFGNRAMERPQAEEWIRTIKSIIKNIPQPPDPTPPPDPMPTEKYCPKCGSGNTVQADFCKTCGYHFGSNGAPKGWFTGIPNMGQGDFNQMTIDELHRELMAGGRFVVYTYTISIMVTFRRGSKIFFIKHDESAIKHGWPYMLISLLLGWWGIPFGPIYTIQSIYYAFTGKDVTREVVDAMNA